MPNALQICSKDGIEGMSFFLYHDEIVDCVSSARSANSYSDQPFSRRICVIFSSISIIKFYDYSLFIFQKVVDF